MEILNFKSARQEQKVKIDDKDYTLREFSGVERQKYQERFKMDFEFGEEGKAKATMGDYKPMSETELVSLCLYNAEDKQVDESVIIAFSSSTVFGLYEAALKLNGLDKKANEKAKNDSKEKTTTGTD